MRAYIPLAAALAAALIKNRPVTAYAWKGVAHADIFGKGLEILKNDCHNDAYEFYSRYHDVMTDSSMAPDRQGDMDKGSGYHYYNIKDVNGKEQRRSAAGYYRSGKNTMKAPVYSRSARSIFEDNYQLALSFFAMGGETNIVRSMEYVGRCVHMISDICCTPHTTDLTLTSKYSGKHKRYEDRANDVFAMFTASHCDKDIYDEYERCETAGENFNLIAEISASYYDTVVHAELIYGLDAVIKQMLMLAQQHVAAFLLRFYNNIHSDTFIASAIVPTATYRLINAAHLGALICDKRYPSGFGISSEEKNMDSSLVKLSVNQAGYYEISFIESGKHVNLAKSKSQRDKSYGFKIAKSVNGFRLLSSVSGYTKALAAGRSGGAGMAKYDPDSKAQHWILERVLF